MTYRACITMIPNNAKGEAAIKLLRQPKVHTRVRGRGHRYMGGTPKNMKARPYDQDLPLELATHYSVYQVKANEPTWMYQYQRGRYIGTEADGRIRIRCEPVDNFK